MEGGVSIPDVLKGIAVKVDATIFASLRKHVFFMFGHPLEITTRLQEMSNAPNPKPDKYPLIALFTDIPVVNSGKGLYGSAKFSMIVATITKNVYTAEQRKELNFKPLLQPIKTALIDEISRNPQFVTQYELPFTEIERYYWGRNGLYGNTGNIFNDYIDCIELQNITVNVNDKICTTLKQTF